MASSSSQLLLHKSGKAFLGHVREIRAEAQNLRNHTLALQSDLTDSHQNLTDVQNDWQTVQIPLYQRHNERVQQLFATISDLMEQDSELLDVYSDDVVLAKDDWELVDPKWPRFSDDGQPLDQHAVNASLDQIKEVDDILCRIIRRTEKLTLPDRVNRLLKELRIGQTIDFHREFSDELPELDARVLALRYLHDHPLLIIGAVDVENGLIYRASSHVWQQRLSPLYIALPAILGAILVYVFYTFFQSDSQHVMNFVKTYIALIAGGFAHGAVEAVKQYRSSKGQTFTALGDLLMWVHVKEWSIIAGIALLWIGFIGLVTLNQGLDWGTAFFVGYSIDSFIDLFLQRFTSVASTRTDALRTQLVQSTGQKP